MDRGKMHRWRVFDWKVALATVCGLLVALPVEGGRATIRPQKSGGKLTRVTASIYRSNLGHGSAPDRDAREFVKDIGCPSDDAGHVVAKRLGGAGEKNSNNIFPQYYSLNRGIFVQYEAQVVKWLNRKCGPKDDQGRRKGDIRCAPEQAEDDYEFTHVDLDVRLNYGDRERPLRPVAIHYIVNGRRAHGTYANKSWSFNNRKPSVCPDRVVAAASLAELESLNKRVLAWLRKSKELRTASGKEVNELATLICEKLDIEDRNDRVSQTVDRAAEELKRKVMRHANAIETEWNGIMHDLEDMVDDKYVGEGIVELMERMDDDWKSLERLLAADVLRGRSSPRLQAKKKYNQDKHDEWFKRYKCDPRATARFRGLDCLSFKNCMIYEFAPPRSNASQDRRDVTQHLKKVNATYRSDPKAAKCWQSGKRGFGSDVEHYPQCRLR